MNWNFKYCMSNGYNKIKLPIYKIHKAHHKSMKYLHFLYCLRILNYFKQIFLHV